jgi:hypothetical protein
VEKERKLFFNVGREQQLPSCCGELLWHLKRVESLKRNCWSNKILLCLSTCGEERGVKSLLEMLGKWLVSLTKNLR